LQVTDHDSHIQYCIGIGFGRVLLLSNDLFGDEVNVAYKLGEDVARSGEILVSEAAHAAIVARSGEFAFSASTQADSGNVSLRFHRLAVH
jgi:adenylate cyclase